MRQVFTSVLEEALGAGVPEVHYQPIFSLVDNRAIALEALARWRHPQRDCVQASEMIPLVVASRMIVPFGRFVLAETVRQTAQRRLQSPGALPLCVFVNVSSREIADPAFIPFLTQTLDEHGLRPEEIGFELTDDDAVVGSHDHTAVDNLEELVRRGHGLSLDDFATRHPALAYLEQVAVSALKIDRSVTSALARPGDDASIASAIVDLGATLGITVIAKGVENQMQLDRVRVLGCDAAQGYYFARPRPAVLPAELVDALAASR